MIGRILSEHGPLSLWWAVSDLIITHSNRVTFAELDRAALDRIAVERRAPRQPQSR
ncbi:MAG: hypothetical protein M3301_09940 [Chloroflexota bacterium]|nr:hypothetical protein [Chloroflexota bacterium]